METITHAGVVLAYLLRTSAPPDRTTYWTPDAATLQVGHVVYPAGSEIPRHAHLPVDAAVVGTSEVLLVQRGHCEVDIYDDDRQLVATRELHVGDILIAVAGRPRFSRPGRHRAAGNQAGPIRRVAPTRSGLIASTSRC